nr:hypothetical protein BaRGS_008296 [Batillaria attramentaria]
MSVDTEHIQGMIRYLWTLWSSPLQICVSLYLLFNLLGAAMVAGLAVLILLIPVNGLVMSKLGALMEKLMLHKDKRLKLINEVLNGMKVSLVTFFTYIYTVDDHYLSPHTAFVAISLLNILRFAINFAPMILTDIIKGSVAYVPQQAWIQNETVRNNILFGRAMDQVRYDECIRVSALQADLDILPAGDLTEIGERGINLSGGQKQRVSLARALYSDADVYLLDSPLSAVDSHVGKYIFEEVISRDGLLKRKTRILVTHGVHWLPMVDQVIVMSAGKVSEVGTFEELLSHNGVFAHFLKTHFLVEAADEKVDDPEGEDRNRIFDMYVGIKPMGEESQITRRETPDEKLVARKDRFDGMCSRCTLTSAGYGFTLLVIIVYILYEAGAVLANIWLSLWTDDPDLNNLTAFPANSSERLDRNNYYLGITLVVISYSTPIFMVAILPLFAVYLTVQRFYIPTSRQLKRLESKTRSPIYNYFSETISGASVIRAYGRQSSFIEESERRVDLNQMFGFASYSANRWLGFRLEFVGPAHEVGKGVIAINCITTNLSWLVRMISDLETQVVSVERVKEYTEIAHEVGIVGRTGAGKSSLTLAMFRLIEPAGGQIYVDNMNIADLGLHDLRTRITILPQDPVIFAGTLRVNLDPFEEYSDDQLWMALQHAHLREFVETLPEKLEYECGEGGENLSVGQRQLLCLARSLLRKTKILILDEATAAVDVETDNLIQRTIRTEFADSTVLTIAHRLNTVMDYDRRTGQVDKLTFDHMESLFHQFTRQLDPSEQSSFREVLSSELVQLVLRAHDHPHLLTFLCHLFPSKFVNCLVAPPRRLLHDLQTAAEEEPWVFGFSKILFTRFRLCGVEANLKAFKTAGLLDQMPNTPKDALHIYEVLKADASRDGHTFISFPALRDHRCFTELGYEVNDWQAALKFLSSNGVTHEERFDSKRNIYLYHFWRAECDVTEGLQEILERGLDAEEPTWKVDFNSCDLERLRGDGDQWNAAQKVASSPITILSGKGGCGKTTVVTHIIRHVCSQTLTPVDPAEQDLDNLFNGDLQEIVPGDKEAQQTTCETPISSQNDPTDSDAPQDLLSALAASQSSEITPELVTQLTDYVTSSQQTRGGGGGGDGQSSEQGKETKKRQLRNDLCVDLIKYLATSGETALSSTSVGGKILLTAPTGKAAKLLGHKASMKSYTLHAVIYSYRTFVSAQARKRRQQEASQETEEGGLNRDGRTRAKPQPAQKGAAKGSKGGTQNQAGSSSAAEEDDDVWKFAATEVLVVDECSLAALRLVATLLNILVEHSQLRKVILLGDVRQLPSIDAGNFLSDVFLTFKERGLSVELSTNHRSESELIVSNATRISQRHVPLFDPTRGFHFWNQGDSEESADPERDAAIRYILTSRPELQNQATSQFVAFRRDHCEAINELCCQYYNQHAIRKADGKGNKRPFDFRVGDKICLKKNGQVMNHGLRLKTFLPPEILRALGITPPPPPKKDRKEVGMDAATAAKKVLEGETVNGDATKTTEGSDANNTAYSVCLTDYGVRMEDLSQDSTAEHQLHSSFAQPRTEADTKSGSVGCEGSQRAESQDGSGSQESKGDEERKDKMKQGDVRLCNGEIFFIMHEEEEIVEGKKPQRYLYLSDRDPLCPRVYCCSLAQLKRECHMQHAWARTIHTYQGSESDTVVYYVGEPVHQTWKHVYTAITRGRKSVFIVGKEKNLRDAVWKSDRPRRSRLSQRLKSMLKGLDIQSQTTCLILIIMHNKSYLSY